MNGDIWYDPNFVGLNEIPQEYNTLSLLRRECKLVTLKQAQETIKLVITKLISKPRTNEQITVETELDTNHVRTTEKVLRILKQEKHTNCLVALEEYPGLNSEDRSLIDQAAPTKFSWALLTQKCKVIQKVKVY